MSSAPKDEGDLRGLDPEHDPVGLDVREVVEHQAADGHRLEVHHAGGLGDLVHPRVVGVEGQRDEGLEAAGLVLELAEPDQVVDPVLGLVDVAVEHRRVRVQAELVGRPVDVEPDLGRRLGAADLLADLGVEDLGAAAGQAAQAGVDQLLQDLADREPGDLGEELDLDARCTP